MSLHIELKMKLNYLFVACLPYLSLLVIKVHAWQHQARTRMDHHWQSVVKVGDLHPPL